jgi:DNA-directed RNA polymerase subunit beta'
MTTETPEFNAVKIGIASPEQILNWSYGEVTKPETINYRTLRPEKDGLFCEKIFGPTKDWECYCGKYKKLRYKGVICDRCGVEVTRSKVRRERMGHIKLAAPVAHIWFAKGSPTRLGLLLDISPRNLERVLYFAQYIVTSLDQESLDLLLSDLREQETQIEQNSKESILAAVNNYIEQNKLEYGVFDESNIGKLLATSDKDEDKELVKISQIASEIKVSFETSLAQIKTKINDIEQVAVMQLLTENRYRDLRDSLGDRFAAAMGAGSIMQILEGIDLDDLRDELVEEIKITAGQRRKKSVKRLRIVEAFRRSGNRAEWMIMSVLPVLPPDLRPMVQLDGGRFATSDLNDLYRRVINRNNRLRRLLELEAPEIIVRNEKRMLQEAVDALIDNGRHGRAIAGSHNHKLKSLSDLLRGKQGRFRQNLLGKRVDYSGRSVIVVGPELLMHQCGLPKKMALELFKPFVMNRLVLEGHAHNVKSAKRMVENGREEVWDILEEVISGRPVLLNRAPTLHRLGIQAFQPVLVEGSAIRLHPLVCTAFNADFDGDQMAVHVPLSEEAVREANEIMLSTHNMLRPSSGEPIVTPTLDIVLGCYYLTQIVEGSEHTNKKYLSTVSARQAYDAELIKLHDLISIKIENEWIDTTVGRIIFNEILPEELSFRNVTMNSDNIGDLVNECYQDLGNLVTAEILDAIKKIGFSYATKSGVTIAINDITVSPKKQGLINQASEDVDEIQEQFLNGLLSEEERYQRSIAVWTKTSDDMTGVIRESLPNYGGVYMMANSGAKGNIAQIKQMAGMRGLMSNPRGRIIELPIKASFREGLSVLEYFISTHGARKGLTDTALRTADSGYLTRRLIDISQDVIILHEECDATQGYWIEDEPDNPLRPPFEYRITGRVVSEKIVHPNTGEILAQELFTIDRPTAKVIVESGINRVQVHSPLTCTCWRGICRQCYGMSLATGQTPLIGESIGIIAAQSIGEPGTQLTMRTFHTGGVAGDDITSGLPRVEELFEARVPKGVATLSEIDGTVEIVNDLEVRRIVVIEEKDQKEEYELPEGYKSIVKNKQSIELGDIIAQYVPKRASKKAEVDLEEKLPLIAKISGIVESNKTLITLKWKEVQRREYLIPLSASANVTDGQIITAGTPLTVGPLNPQDILRILGRDAVQKYLISQVQAVYRSQGITINDKHIEIIVRQMLRKIRVDRAGDTDLLPGELIDRFVFEEQNRKIIEVNGNPAVGSPVLLGVTRASLNTESFLAAASFQETTRVLTEAAVSGSTDPLLGLKENVIIGRLIPARLDLSEEGRKRYNLPYYDDSISVSTGDQDKVLAESLSISDDMVSSDPFASVKLEDIDGIDFLSSGFQVENEKSNDGENKS